MGVEENEQLVPAVVAQVVNGGDRAAIDGLYAPEIAASARASVALFQESLPDVRMGPVAMVAEGDVVVGHFRCSGTHSGPWRGRPGTGRSLREVYWSTVRDGRVVDQWGLEDDDRPRQSQGPPGGSGSAISPGART